MSSILNRFLDDLCDTDAYKQYEYEFNKKRMENEIRMEKKREELETNRMGREDKVTLDMAAAYIRQLNMIIKRYHNSRLTKKQKASKKEYCTFCRRGFFKPPIYSSKCLILLKINFAIIYLNLSSLWHVPSHSL